MLAVEAEVAVAVAVEVGEDDVLRPDALEPHLRRDVREPGRLVLGAARRRRGRRGAGSGRSAKRLIRTHPRGRRRCGSRARPTAVRPRRRGRSSSEVFPSTPPGRSTRPPRTSTISAGRPARGCVAATMRAPSRRRRSGGSVPWRRARPWIVGSTPRFVTRTRSRPSATGPSASTARRGSMAACSSVNRQFRTHVSVRKSGGVVRTVKRFQPPSSTVPYCGCSTSCQRTKPWPWSATSFQRSAASWGSSSAPGTSRPSPPHSSLVNEKTPEVEPGPRDEAAEHLVELPRPVLYSYVGQHHEAAPRDLVVEAPVRAGTRISSSDQAAGGRRIMRPALW